MSIQVSTANDVKVYNISTGKSLPEVSAFSYYPPPHVFLCSGYQREKEGHC